MIAEPLSSKLFADPTLLVVGESLCLAASHCDACDRYEFPVLAVCPACGRPAEVAKMSTTAVVESKTAVLHTPPGSLIEAPYTVVVAAFPEGISVLGVLADTSIDEVAIGDKVCTVGVDVGGRVGFAFNIIPS